MKDGTVNLVKIHVFGAFCVTGPDGADLTPRSEKGQALLALLVTAPHHKRTRGWLQDKLWSRSDPARGGANLRQVLATLRRALGCWDHVLQADRRAVWLDPSLISTDWTDRAATDPSTFLEGIDVDDPEFGAWLATLRNASAGTALCQPLAAPARRAPRRWRIALGGSAAPDGLVAHLEADVLSHLSRSLLETGVADIATTGNDARDPLAIDVALSLTPIGEGRYGVRVSVIKYFN